MAQQNAARIEQIKSLITALLPKAETGEQWADICALEAELVQLGAHF